MNVSLLQFVYVVCVRGASCSRLYRFAVQYSARSHRGRQQRAQDRTEVCSNCCLLSTAFVELHNSALITVSTQAAAMRGDVTARTLF